MRRATSDGLAFLLPLVAIGLLSGIFLIEPMREYARGAYSLQALLTFALLTISAGFWLRYRSDIAWSQPAALMLWALVLLWILVNYVAYDHGGFYWGQASIALPIAVIMLILKRPSISACVKAADIFAYIILGLVLLFIVIESLSPSSTGLPKFFDSINLEFAPVGWNGPLENPNATAPLGAFLVIYGAVKHGLARLVLVVSGVFILFATTSRTTVIGLFLAVLTMLFAHWWNTSSLDARRYIGRFSWPVFGALVIAIVGYIALIDPTLNGRTPVWSAYWDLFLSMPITGVGDPGISLLVSTNTDPVFTYGHNLVLDGLARYGAIATSVVLAVWGLALAVALRGSRQNLVVGLGIWVFLTGLAVSEAPFDWRFLSHPVTFLLLIPLLADGQPSVARAPSNAKSVYSS